MEMRDKLIRLPAACFKSQDPERPFSLTHIYEVSDVSDKNFQVIRPEITLCVAEVNNQEKNGE